MKKTKTITIKYDKLDLFAIGSFFIIFAAIICFTGYQGELKALQALRDISYFIPFIMGIIGLSFINTGITVWLSEDE